MRASARIGSASSPSGSPLARISHWPERVPRGNSRMPQSGSPPALSGRIQIWNSVVSSSSRLYSAWATPVPALITCTSPAAVRPSLPIESLWLTAPARTKVTISMSEWLCGGKPERGAILSSFHTRMRPQPMRSGSM